MPVFDYQFTVDAPFEAVSGFHHSTEALKVLTPPPMIVRFHDIEPLAEGSVSRFTVWGGPIPLHWTAVHSNVSADGFTDTQESGVMKKWEHTHRYEPIDSSSTRVTEHIEYEFAEGGKDRLIGLAFFNRAALTALFAYRKFRTRWALRGWKEADVDPVV